jgi:hypothetical protein
MVGELMITYVLMNSIAHPNPGSSHEHSDSKYLESFHSLH